MMASNLSIRRLALRTSASAIIGLACLAPVSAYAQQAAASEQQAEEQNSGGLEEITVTARKRSENLQETPVAITAMTGAMLEEKQIVNVAEVAKFAPNVSISPVANISGSSASITAFIRGVGQTDFNITVDPGVGVYVDGVYVARSVGALLDMADVSSVQVLRGPQGTLFGKNTIGGAIVVNSVEPQKDFDMKLEAATGRFNRADFKGMINVPLGENLAMRAVASYETRDGYQKRLFDGGRQGNKDSFGGRVAFKWEPTDKFTVNLSADINIRREEMAASTLVNLFESPNLLQVVDLNGRTVVFPSSTYAWNKLQGGAGFCGADGQLAPVNDPRCATTQWITGDIDSTWSGAKNQSDFDLWGTNLTLDYDFGDINLKSISSYRDQKATIQFDFDGTPHPYLNLTNNIDLWQASQEFQLTGSVLNDRVKFVLGGYYLKEKGQDKNNLLFGFADFFSGGKIDNDSYAAYLQATIKVTDRLSITPGIRYTDETKRFDPSFQTINVDYTAPLGQAGIIPYPQGVFIAFSQCVTGQPVPLLVTDPASPLFGFPLPGGCAPAATNPGGNHTMPAVQVAAKAKEWTPAISADYKITDDILVYASYSKGFKNGGFTQRIFPAEQVAPSFRPEFVESYELGLKTELLDRRLRLNLAAFMSNYDDIQVVVSEGIAPRARNAGSGRIKGFEVEGEAAPTDWLRLTFGVGYLDAYYRSIDPFAFPVNLNSKFAFVPEWTGSASFNADVYEGDMGKLTLRGDWSYQSETFKDAINSPQLRQPGYSVFGASASFTEKSEHFTVTAGVTNLTDERYIQGGYVDPFVAGTALATYSRPREWFLKLAYKY
ncbi:iron complex outermembrane receptor protein [Novosphingobium kunmingense]|uniref:Iron complex outermembrane receptor protein n=1 Tax=Novosphingobium kunmingense TaxID=1211806 RepID=A0A2N0H3U1_9SPHN|nr:TonB-dependent receptor [Novosphingobium kunmingense]PKB13606.1 iron complex outermembrane receptor protein [Novosphingobium kunmingense]